MGTSYDPSILGPGCSRFMIHDSGSVFDLMLARLVHSTRPPRDRHATVGNSLLDASATMAKVEVELHPAVAVAIGLGLSFYASLDASLDGNGGVTPKARAERCDRRVRSLDLRRRAG